MWLQPCFCSSVNPSLNLSSDWVLLRKIKPFLNDITGHLVVVVNKNLRWGCDGVSWSRFLLASEQSANLSSFLPSVWRRGCRGSWTFCTQLRIRFALGSPSSVHLSLPGVLPGISKPLAISLGFLQGNSSQPWCKLSQLGALKNADAWAPPAVSDFSVWNAAWSF